jgi:hypothetical protein
MCIVELDSILVKVIAGSVLNKDQVSINLGIISSRNDTLIYNLDDIQVVDSKAPAEPVWYRIDRQRFDSPPDNVSIVNGEIRVSAVFDRSSLPAGGIFQVSLGNLRILGRSTEIGLGVIDVDLNRYTKSRY